MRKINISLLIILLFTGCFSGDSEQLVTIGSKYSISLPSFLTKARVPLNDDASLQYMNTWKEFYVIVIDESKSEMQKALIDNDLSDVYSSDIIGYSDLLIDSFEKEVSTYNKSDIIDTKINDLPARLLSFSGRIEGIDVYYSIAFVEGKERYYQIMTWTLTSKKSQYNDRMEKIIHSFNELELK